METRYLNYLCINEPGQRAVKRKQCNESSRREEARYRWGGVAGVSARGHIFWLESHGQVAPCPFLTASGYRTPIFIPSPSSPSTATGTVFHRQKKKQTFNLLLRLLAGHARRPPHATNRLLFSKYLSIEIRTSPFLPLEPFIDLHVFNPPSDHPLFPQE